MKTVLYNKTCLKRPLKKNTKIGFQYKLSLNADQKYCRMLQGEHSAILSTFIKLPFSIKTFFVVFKVAAYCAPSKTLFCWEEGGGGGGIIIGVGPKGYPLFLTSAARVFHLHVSVEALRIYTTKFTCDTN